MSTPINSHRRCAAVALYIILSTLWPPVVENIVALRSASSNWPTYYPLFLMVLTISYYQNDSTPFRFSSASFPKTETRINSVPTPQHFNLRDSRYNNYLVITRLSVFQTQTPSLATKL